jgi:sugar-specific transcriptional regulator TrmB
MRALQKLGLTEKIVAKPTMYKATPINEGLSILLQNMKSEYDKLQKKTTLLINNFHAKNAKITLKQEEDTQFIITSEITRLIKIHRNKSWKAQESIDVMIPVTNVPSEVRDDWLHFKKPLKRGVKVRVITPKLKDIIAPAPWEAIVTDPCFELKYSVTPIPFGMHIFDKRSYSSHICEHLAQLVVKQLQRCTTS